MTSNLPELDENDYVILEKLYTEKSNQFFYNATQFFITECKKYVQRQQCLRISIMGETRSGKSETAITLCLLFTNFFNECQKKGLFNKSDVITEGFAHLKKNVFDTTNILSSQHEYINILRHKAADKTLNYGQFWQIDETIEQTGGIGSYTEEIELRNVNNIVAKFFQNEIWICPVRFKTQNCPYGLRVYKKDVINRVNWCLLYKIDQSQTIGYSFLGWVNVPLHTNEVLRKEYDHKKNLWIQEQFMGGGNTRMKERKKTAEQLSQDELFSELRPPSYSMFLLSKQQQLALLENYIIQHKCPNFNELERIRIVEEARLLVIQKLKYSQNKSLKQNGI